MNSEKDFLVFNPEDVTLKIKDGNEWFIKGENFRSSILVEEGEYYFIVYVNYTTGDSFNPNSDMRTEVIDLYDVKSKDIAIETAKEIRRHYKERKKESEPLLVKMGNGKDMVLRSPPWFGYFEKLDEVVVRSVMLTFDHVYRF